MFGNNSTTRRILAFMRNASLAFGALVLTSVLAGCTSTSAASTPAPSTTPSPTHITAIGVTKLIAPKGARSADLTVSCAGSNLGLTVGNELQPRAILCGTDSTMIVPTGHELALDFEPSNGTTFTATVRFSPSVFHSDATLTAQCAAATQALSDLASAVNGVGEGAIDPSQAQVFTTHAAQALAHVSTAGVAGQQLAALRAWLTANPTADPKTAPPVRDARSALRRQ